MANLMKNPTEWRKKKLRRLTVENTLMKHWIDVERQKADAATYIHNLKIRQI